MIEVEAKNSCNIKIAKKMQEIAQMKADTIDCKAENEAKITSVMEARRKYEHLDAKVDVISSFKDNANLKVFGDNNDNVLSQMAAYRITNEKKSN